MPFDWDLGRSFKAIIVQYAPMPRKKTFDHLIVGSGLAGLATAFFLAERSDPSKIAVTDREPGPGLAASSRSASMICQLVRDTVTCRIMVRSARLLREVWLARFPDVRFEPTGSLHIGLASDMAAFDPSVRAARSEGVDIERLTKDEAVRRFPSLDRTEFEAALWCPSDGVVDTERLIWRLWQDLRTRGVYFGFTADGRVEAREGSFETLVGPGNWLSAPVLVNAAGAWADEVARSAGASPLAVSPMRRHVFITREFEPSLRFPIVWDVSREIYVRPEGPAVMTSPCDEEPQPAGPSLVTEAAAELLEDKLKSFFPRIVGAKHVKIWSGLRTFSGDRRFVIGWDGKKQNFFWTACLGGYGVTAAAGCGELAAQLLTRQPADPELVRSFSPDRF